VSKGIADPKLLATYEAERRPVGKLTVEQAYTRYVTRTATYLGATDFQPLVPDFNIELGHLHYSPAILAEDADGKVHDDPHQTRGRPGSRAPHVWLERNGRRISSLDLFGAPFVLLAGPQGAAWCAAAGAAAQGFAGLDLDCHCVGAEPRDPDDGFAPAYGLAPTGAVLVRPDGFVGWRATAMADDPQGVIVRALGAMLMR
jgi:putative polyketide hydroxylase